MVVEKRAEVPGGFGGSIFFLGNCLCLWDHADYFFLGGFPRAVGSATMWILF